MTSDGLAVAGGRGPIRRDAIPGPASPDAEQARMYFDRVYDAFLRARAKRGGFDADYAIAGQRCTLSFAGETLVPALTPAFDHLTLAEDVGDDSDLTICVWDGTSAAGAPAAPPWMDAGYLGNTELAAAGDGPVHTAFDAYLGMLSMYDRERKRALFWLRDGRRVPITLIGTPFRIILQWWAAGHHGQLIHAAAVASDRGGVAIVGPSGAGKSTTALIGLESGLRYAGDDFVLVQSSAEPRVFGVYSSAKLDRATLDQRFPGLRAAVHDRPRLPEEKEVLFVHRRWPNQTASDFPLRAMFLPAFVDGAASRLVPVGAADALRTLLPGILAFPGQRQAAVSRLARLARAVPSYRLELGSDSSDIGRVLQTFLHDPVRTA